MLTVFDCLEKFTESERLGNKETMFCSSCKVHMSPLKKFDLWTVANTLIIHLKRFKYTTGQFLQRSKISELVEFPVTGLDLSEYVKLSMSTLGSVYDLFAVSEHSGGLGGGHYTAKCRNFENGKWFYSVPSCRCCGCGCCCYLYCGCCGDCTFTI